MAWWRRNCWSRCIPVSLVETPMCLKTRTSNPILLGQWLTHKSEFILLNTCGMHLLPYPVQSYRHHLGDRMWNNSLPISGFPSTLNCGLALTWETFLSDFQNIRGVRHAKEVLRVMQAIGLGIHMRQLRIDSRFPKRFASHFKEANEVVMFASMTRDFDDFSKVGRIFSLDIRVCKKGEVSSRLRERATYCVPIESLIRRPSNCVLASRFQTSGLLTLLA
jgi:hypothetical protein